MSLTRVSDSRRPHRLVAQDGALSRPKQGFESPWGHRRVINMMALFFSSRRPRGMLFESPCPYQDTAQGGLIKSYCWIAQDRFLEQLVDFHRGLCLKNDFPRKHCQLALHFLQVAR